MKLMNLEFLMFFSRAVQSVTDQTSNLNCLAAIYQEADEIFSGAWQVPIDSEVCDRLDHPWFSWMIQPITGNNRIRHALSS